MLARWVLAGGLVCLLADFSGPLGAVTLSVCAKGCNYADFQEALDAAAGDCTIDTIELRAGEVFSGYFRPRFRNCTAALIIQSSRWRELPPLGYRVDPARHAELMPIVTSTNFTLPVIQFGQFEIMITGVNLSTGTLELEGYPASKSVQVGSAISCTDTGNGVGPTMSPQPGLPAPLARRTKYYVTAIASRDGYAIRRSTGYQSQRTADRGYGQQWSKFPEFLLLRTAVLCVLR